MQLRGHDFTGLGFNVTGNMRDGIFVKDVLNRGPAFECGRVAQGEPRVLRATFSSMLTDRRLLVFLVVFFVFWPGDRILGVTISFRHVVYEDALTILSYASPYDVALELQKGRAAATGTLAKQRRAASAGSLAPASPPPPPDAPVVHPLYRSQSIDDLSKVPLPLPDLGPSVLKI